MKRTADSVIRLERSNRTASWRAVAVATGGYSVAELEATGANAVFPDFAEVKRVMEAILS